MYSWCYTWNPLGGKCYYACDYCYVKNKIGPWLERMGNPKYVVEPYLEKGELKTRLVTPSGELIFVQSNGDLFGEWIPREWIILVLKHCNQYPENAYLFQTKNPERMTDFLQYLPDNSILGTTLETNRNDLYEGRAPKPSARAYHFWNLPWKRKMVSVEPILDFDLILFVDWLRTINPLFVSVGADSLGCGLPEPSGLKVDSLISLLEGFTEVRKKDNLKRILEDKGEK